MTLALRRVGALLSTVLALVAATALPASAHTVGGSGASDYRTRLLTFNGPPGVTLAVVENGNKLELTNRTRTPVTVLGYSNEPYLRVTAAGVQANQRSTATFANVDRYLTNVVIPRSATNKGVDYTTISNRPVAIWHDHRIHWMATTPPPAVAAAPDAYRVIQTWTINFRYGSTPFSATGELDWVPGPSPAAPVLIAVAALLVAGVLALRSRRLLGSLLLALTALDVVHTLGVAADRAGSTVAGGLGAYPVVDVIWVLALSGAGLLVAGRRRRLGLALTVVTGAWMLLVGGFADVATFKDTTAPFAWSIALERVLTALETGIGGAVVAVAVRDLVRVRPVRAGSRFEDDVDEDYDYADPPVSSSAGLA